MEMDLTNVNSEDIEYFLMNFDGGEIYLNKEHWNEGIAVMFIDHPRKKNAISGKMMVDLRRCLEELENWTAGKAVIFTSTGTNFCSGGDLTLVTEAGNAQGGLLISRYMHETLIRFRKLPLVTVALIQGPTLGGGAELSVYSDYILMAENVKFGFVHGKMGIITAWGGATRLVQIIGQRKAMEMLLSSKMYSANECLELGLAHKIVKTSDSFNEALAFTKQLTTTSVSVLKSFKSVINNAVVETFENSLKFERDEFYPMWGNETQQAAVRNKVKHVIDSCDHK